MPNSTPAQMTSRQGCFQELKMTSDAHQILAGTAQWGLAGRWMWCRGRGQSQSTLAIKQLQYKKLVENEREGSKQLVRQDEIHIGHWCTKPALDTRNLRQCYILMRYVCKFVIKSFESINSRSMRK